VKVLLDTHAFLWWLNNPLLLADRARVAIANPKNFVFVSAVSFVEIAIKENQNKLTTASQPESKMAECRFVELPLTIAHASALRGLPLIHKDPFDRLLIAQAQVEGLTIITRDEKIEKYDVPVMAA
jgi:PIN domain nuclease of toxin-antitoxin system